MLCAINLVLDYVFGTAAVVRNLSQFMSILFVDQFPVGRPCGDLKLSSSGAPTYVPGPGLLGDEKYVGQLQRVGSCNMFQVRWARVVY